ncbi:MAG TPA: amino acid permease [Candidatus Polarisedimenticolia bacterium]|jgi:APA family basic amino acid/polyamine antiporter|nr:amino acid permease [Candidatus Polarisedimenticolia bacterium]
MGLSDLFRTKSVDSLSREAGGEGHATGLKRTLTGLDLMMLGIGAVIGTGIFAAIGTATAGNADRPGAGPAIIVSFIITAIACVFSALCYAEFASMIPVSGSAYTYAYATLGETIAWIIGWDLIIEYAVGNIAVAISWAGYFNDVLKHTIGTTLPSWVCTDLRTALRTPEIVDAAPHLFGWPIVLNLPAVVIVALVTWVLVIGVKESARINNLMVGLKIVILLLFVAVGCTYVRTDHLTPFFPGGWAGVQAGAAIIFFSFIGFDAVSTAAEECRNPRRDIPIGILGSLAVCTLLYVAVATVLVGVMPWSDLGVADPLAKALSFIGQDRAAGMVSFGAIVAMTAVLLVFQLGQPRIFFSMSRDGLLPPIFARVHPRYRTPHVTTIWTGVFVAFFGAFASLDEILELTNIGTLFAFILVCVGVMVLRVKDPARPRPFRMPWIPLLPIWALMLWFLPPAFLAAEDWGARFEYLFLFAIAAAGMIFSVTGIAALLRRRTAPEWVRTEFCLAGIASCLYLMRGLPALTWWRFLGWLAIGLFIYSLYGVRHSRLAGGAPPPLAQGVKWLGIATAVVAAAAWWRLPHPTSLIVPIAMLFAFSAFALSVNRRRTA